VSHCGLKDTTYPPLAIYDGVLGYIKKSAIGDSAMSGIVIRNRSKALIKKVGIVVIDYFDVSISMSFIFNCAEAAFSCSDHSEVHVRSSFLAGPSKISINLFTRGFVYAADTTITSMRDVAVWLHHGGSGRLQSTLVHTVVCETKEAIVE
jgi:hypothetical protein